MKNLRGMMGTTSVHAYLIHSLAAHGLLLSLIVVIPLYGDGGSGRPSGGQTVMLAGSMDGLGILPAQIVHGLTKARTPGQLNTASDAGDAVKGNGTAEETAMQGDNTAANAIPAEAEQAGMDEVQGPAPVSGAAGPASAPPKEPDAGPPDNPLATSFLKSTEQIPVVAKQPDAPARREVPEAAQSTAEEKAAPVPSRENTKAIATPPERVARKISPPPDRPPEKTVVPLPPPPSSAPVQPVTGLIPAEPPPVAQDAGSKAGDPKPEEAATKSPVIRKTASAQPADPPTKAQPVREEPREDIAALAPALQKESPEKPVPSPKTASTVRQSETPSLPGGPDSQPPSPQSAAAPGGKTLAAGGEGSAPHGLAEKAAGDGGLKKNYGAGGEGRGRKGTGNLKTAGMSSKGPGSSRGMPGGEGGPGNQGLGEGSASNSPLSAASSTGSGPGVSGGQENVAGAPGAGVRQGALAATDSAPKKIAVEDSAQIKSIATEMSVAKVFLNRDIQIEVSLQGDPSALGVRLSRGPHPSQRPKRGKPRVEEVMMSEDPADAGGKRVFSVAGAPHGAYTLVVDYAGKEPREGEVIFHLYKRSEKGRTKKYAAVRMVSGRPAKFRFVLPEALFWDDDDRFSGTIEDSRTMTKFTFDSSLIWREDKD